jgi:hypothetical protein
MKNEILNARNFDDARNYFIEACQTGISKDEQLELLKYLDCKTENAVDVCIMIEFYKSLRDTDALLKYIHNCMYKEDPTVRSKIISIEAKFGSVDNAGNIIHRQGIDEITITQEAAFLNRTGESNEARKLLEKLFLTHVSRYSIKVYASAINNLLKNDEYACDLCIPNLARSICREEKVSSFDAKRLLTKMYQFEHDIGNKKGSNILQNILNNYNYQG